MNESTAYQWAAQCLKPLDKGGPNFEMYLQQQVADNIVAALLAASKEATRLEYMMRYALSGPDDAHCLKSLIFDALNGCSGADNQDEIHAKFGEYSPTMDKVVSQKCAY